MADMSVAGICTFLEIISFHLLQVIPPTLLCPFPFPLQTAADSLVAWNELAIETLQLPKITAWRAGILNSLCLTFNHVHNYRAENQHWAALYTVLHRNQAGSFKYILTHPKIISDHKAFYSISGFPPEVRVDVCITSSIPFFIHWIKSIAKSPESLLCRIWLPHVTCR